MSSPTFKPVVAGGGGTTDHSVLENRDAASQHPGGSVTLDTTGFDGNLSASDSTVQAAMETIDGFDIGASLPVADTTAIVKDPTTATKQMRIDVGAVSAETTRVLTMPNQDVDLTPGTGTFQGADPTLTALAGITTAADKIPYFTGSDTAAVMDIPPGYNYIVNPCFEINQEGNVSVNTFGKFPVDQWSFGGSGSSGVSSQQVFTVGQTDVPGEPKNYLRTVVTSSAGSGNFIYINQAIEYVRTLAGRNAVLSFNAKADAAKPIAIEFLQIFGTGGSTLVLGIGVTKVTLSANWTKYTVPITIPSISGKTIGAGDCLMVNLWLDAGSDFNARTDSLGQQSGTFEFANVKLEEGTVATPCIVPRFDDELRKCMRFYWSPGNSNSIGAIAIMDTAIVGTVLFPVVMRTAPTITFINTGVASGHVRKTADNSDVDLGTHSPLGANTSGITGLYSTSLTPFVVGAGYDYQMIANARL